MKTISSKPDDAARTYYVLALDHQPGIIVMKTADEEEAKKVRDDYQRIHGGTVILTITP